MPNKVARELRDLARQYTGEALTATVKALRRMVRLMDDRKVGEAQQIQAAACIGSLSNILFDRGHGKPTQLLEVKRTPFDDMSPDELRALEAALEALPDDASGPSGGDQGTPVDGAAGGVSSLH